MFRRLLFFLQSYLLVKKPFYTLSRNRFYIFSILKHSKVRVDGFDNIIEIHDGDFKRIKIGISGNGNKIIIESENYIRNLELIIEGDNHTISIGKRTEIGEATIVCCGKDSSVTIGDDCLLASGIDIKSCDGHTIYKNGKVINHSKNIIINHHVWISQGVKILKGSSIGAHSVVGINSVVTSNIFETHVILGGIPAKVLNTNITWGKERTL